MTEMTDARYQPPQAPVFDPFVAKSVGDRKLAGRLHLYFAIFYLGLVAVFTMIASGGAQDEGLWGAMLFLSVPGALHAALWHGARRGSEWARRGSRAVGILMLFGFPIGTLVGFFLIRSSRGSWAPRPVTLGPPGVDMRGA